MVTVSLDSSGQALSRRGYRTWNGEAPLRETLASALALLSPWRSALPLHDPCCGTGTLLIEAAFIALNRAPGLMREFACEGWGFMPEEAMRQAWLEGKIDLSRQDLRTLQLSGGEGVFLCNPPYGERLSDRKSCEKLYRELRLLKERHPGWSLCAISSDPAFERAYGRRADKKRRLYNGRLECEFLIYR